MVLVQIVWTYSVLSSLSGFLKSTPDAREFASIPMPFVQL